MFLYGLGFQEVENAVFYIFFTFRTLIMVESRIISTIFNGFKVIFVFLLGPGSLPAGLPTKGIHL